MGLSELVESLPFITFGGFKPSPLCPLGIQLMSFQRFSKFLSGNTVVTCGILSTHKSMLGGSCHSLGLSHNQVWGSLPGRTAVLTAWAETREWLQPRYAKWVGGFEGDVGLQSRGVPMTDCVVAIRVSFDITFPPSLGNVSTNVSLGNLCVMGKRERKKEGEKERKQKKKEALPSI